MTGGQPQPCAIEETFGSLGGSNVLVRFDTATFQPDPDPAASPNPLERPGRPSAFPNAFGLPSDNSSSYPMDFPTDRFRVPLWLVFLIIPVVALTSVGLISALVTYTRGEAAMERISTNFRSLALTTVENEVTRLIGALDTTVIHFSESVRASTSSPDDPTALEFRKAMSLCMKANALVTSLSFVSSATGYTLMLSRDSSELTWGIASPLTRAEDQSIYAGYAPYHGWTDAAWNASASNITVATAFPFNGTQRWWYVAAVEHGDGIVLPLSSVSIVPTGVALSQPVSIAIRDPLTEQLVGVAATRISLSHFDNFLRAIVATLIHRTMAFIVEQETGFLLASSSGSSEYAVKSEDYVAGVADHILAIDATDADVRSVARAIADPLAGWKEIDNATVSTRSFFANVHRVHLQGVSWILVVGTNKAVWMETVNSGTWVTFGVVSALICGFSLLSVVVSRLVSIPLHRVIRDVHSLCKMRLEDAPLSTSSRLSEVARLVHCVNLLTFHLREFRTFLPEPILNANLDRTATEDGELDEIPEAPPVPPVAALRSTPSLTRKASSESKKVGTAGPSGFGMGSIVGRFGGNSSNSGDQRSYAPPKPITPRSLATQPSSLNVTEMIRNPSATQMITPRMKSPSQNELVSAVEPFREIPMASALSVTPTSQSAGALGTVVCVDMANSDRVAFRMGLEELGALHYRYTDLVHRLVQQHKGTLDVVLGDRMFALWNVPKRCSRAELKAVEFAMAVEANFKAEVLDFIPPESTLQPSSTAFSRTMSSISSPRVMADNQNANAAFAKPKPLVRIGIASSMVRCGIFGNDAVRRFAVLGAAVGQSVILQKMVCKMLDVPVLITQNVAKQVECQVLCYPMVVLRLIASGITLPCHCPVRLFNSAVNDEWMYTLRSNNAEGEDVRQLFSEYCQHVRSGLPMILPMDGGTTTRRPSSSAGSSGNDDETNEVSDELRRTIARFPLGIEVPFLF